MYSDAFLDALSADGSIPGYAVELDFPDGISRAHSGVGEAIIGGNVFTGVGSLGAVGEATEYGDSNPGSISLELRGIPGEELSSTLSAKCRGRDASVYVLVWSEHGQLLYAELMMKGSISSCSVKIGTTNKINLSVSDKFELYERPWNQNWSDASHQAIVPNDAICRFVNQTADREISWGSKEDAQKYTV